MVRSMTSGGGGGTKLGGGGSGLSILTACVMLGIVMMKMIRSTNMTSINGVMLMSEYDWPSPPPPTFMAMRLLLRSGTEMIGGGYERHFAYADLLRGHEYLAHELVPNVCIAANVHFRLRFLARDSPQLILQLVLARQFLVVPINVPLLIYGYRDVFRLRLRRQVRCLRQIQLHLLDDHPNRYDENDQEHQHHVHERSYVDVRHRLRFFTSDIYGHGPLPLAGGRRLGFSHRWGCLVLVHAQSHLCARDQVGMQLMGEVADHFLHALIAAQ